MKRRMSQFELRWRETIRFEESMKILKIHASKIYEIIKNQVNPQRRSSQYYEEKILQQIKRQNKKEAQQQILDLNNKKDG